MKSRWANVVSVPEKLVRMVAAVLGGTVHETVQLALPRFVRQSSLYEATAKNLLRISIEFVGGVEPETPGEASEPSAGKLLARKATGNVVELG